MSAKNGQKRSAPDTVSLSENPKKGKVDSVGGTLLFSGLSDYDQRNDKSLAKNPAVKWSPHQFEALDGVKIAKVSSGVVSYHFLAVSVDGVVYSWGFNQKGQLGLGDSSSRSSPEPVSSLSGYKVVAVATGRQHSLVLTAEGLVFAFGDNKSGQCGVGNKKDVVSTPQALVHSGSSIVQIACGAEFSLILDDEGRMYSFGHPEYGQLGLGSENKSISRANKIDFHCEFTPVLVASFVEKDPDTAEVLQLGQPVIKQISCGANHSVAIDEDSRCFTWGFGGYGRLGHNSTQDEHLPRLMRCWFRVTGRPDAGVLKVTCGAQFNMAETVAKQNTLMWGQYKMAGEANMYPKIVDDLAGWNVQHMACGQNGWICVADETVIGCLPSPCIGQLAMGEKVKSSAKAKIIDTLKGIRCVGVALGYMHSLFIALDETEKDKAAIAKFPLLKS